MAKIEVDGTTYEVADDKNLLDACLGLGLDLPYFCWHPTLGSVGSCRQCAVRVYADENDTQGRIVMSCMTPVQDGQRLSINEEKVQEFRDLSIEVTMSNHPHDCPVCEEGGECHLQDMTIMSNHTERRYRGLKKTYNNQYLGPCISHEMNRCIACYRCVRFYNDYAGGEDLAALASRENVYFGRHEDGCLESVFSGNLVEVCPTGVFTDKTLGRSYNRKWDLQAAPSICHGCSLGCNISPNERAGKIKRIVNRYHHDVNGYFICDRGRFGYDYMNSDDRIQHCSIHHQLEATEEAPDYYQALDAVCDVIESGGLEKIIAIGSDRASIEENFALQTLVGNEHFFSGLSSTQHDLVQEIVAIYKQPHVHVPSLREIQACDAVFVLGEDLTQSAPIMALSVRQATRNLSFELADAANIPQWQDASVRTLAQNQRSPLIVAATGKTELDEIAALTFFADPNQLAQLGFAVAHAIDNNAPSPSSNNSYLNKTADKIANYLSNAKNPVIISGTSNNSIELARAAAQVAYALCSNTSTGKKSTTNLVYSLSAANSMGLALLHEGDREQHLGSAIKKVLDNPGEYSAIILQNDLYGREDPSIVDTFVKSLKKSIVIDHQVNNTTDNANILIPASTFVETEGTLVSNEGRAQRYFEVFNTENPHLRDNWKTIANFAKDLANRGWKVAKTDKLLALAECEKFDDLVALVKQRGGFFAEWDSIAPKADFRIAGMKVPRMPHRFSGRTSLYANEQVAEKKQPEDIDSALGFTMEGAPIDRPAALNPIFWSPQWNSNEAINKFQDEINGPLRGGDPGLRLFDNNQNDNAVTWFSPKVEIPTLGSNRLLGVSLVRIFDGELLSAKSDALRERAPARTLRIHPKTASNLKISNGDKITVSLGDNKLKLSVALDEGIADNVIGIPSDVETNITIPATLLPAVVTIGKG